MMTIRLNYAKTIDKYLLQVARTIEENSNREDWQRAKGQKGALKAKNP